MPIILCSRDGANFMNILRIVFSRSTNRLSVIRSESSAHTVCHFHFRRRPERFVCRKQKAKKGILLFSFNNDTATP